MKNAGRTVIGVYGEREDAVREIQRLESEGYSQAQISVYSNPERARTVERLMGINVEDVDADEVEEDTSWWDTIKNSFNFFVYEADQGDNRIHTLDDPKAEREPLDEAGITETTDLLEPYKEDLAAGRLVIVVENYDGRNRP